MSLRRGLWCLLLCLTAAACASREVRCEGDLEPVNAPAAAAQPQHPANGAAARHDPDAP